MFSKKTRLLEVVSVILTAFIILFLPFQNTILGATPLGFLGKAPSFFFIFMQYVVLVLSFFFSAHTHDEKVSKLKFYFFIYLCVVNVFSLLVYFGEVEYGRSLLGKGFNLFVLNMLFLYPIFIKNKLDSPVIKKLLMLSLCVSIFGVVVGDILNSSIVNNVVFQVSERVSPRPRGFSYEASMLGATIFPLLFSYFCLKNKKNNFSFFYLVIFFCIAMVTSSKGAIIALLVSFLLSYFFSARIFSFYGLFFLLIFVVTINPVIDFLVDSVLADLDDHTSIATRGICIYAAIVSLLDHPFGVGYFGFLSAFKGSIEQAIDFVNQILPIKLNLYEVEEYIYADTDSAIGTKSFFFNNIICFGWPFVFLFLIFSVSLVRKCRKYKRKDLELSFIFVLISLISFVEGIGLYPISFFMSVLFYELRQCHLSQGGYSDLCK